ncbi:hypothetical protein L228DRAFT_237753 [Xylona heveae TC161]|uniref:N-methyltransferase n=1 Tax=Xylona heveae (strain CBS 132557 / TC161) TaxID=1328760 RepID=A0A165H955_XYLHT|nr:hypothetical protein L228DRAFT_237753 [Xylona heveae TC161]KZF23160.1 hypothetical protein L228DRAFT_237753 [Xylona heveae TC161]
MTATAIPPGAAPPTVLPRGLNPAGYKYQDGFGDGLNSKAPLAETRSTPTILDIRQNEIKFSIRDDMLQQLQPSGGQEKKLPTLLLYDEAGLKLFEQITYLEEYYLTNAEIEALEKHADRIAERIAPDSVMVELGSGNLRKVNILLSAIDRKAKHVQYYALDLSLPELQRTLSAIPEDKYRHVKCCGLLGTYDDGLVWLQKQENANKPKAILSLGSSVGNFSHGEAGDFLRRFALTMGEKDCMLLGLDACVNSSRVYHAYNDRHGLTHQFILNGLNHANQVLGKEIFRVEDWQVIGEFDEAARRHQAFVSPRKDVSIEQIQIKAGERLRIEESYKYPREIREKLFDHAGLCERATWTNDDGDYGIHMLCVPRFSYHLNPEQYAASPVPSLADWEGLWAAWDTVVRRMLPGEELHSKPIKLRNACIFYLGHIPTFLDIHLTRATAEAPTEPSYYREIFERGIDPDVDNPEQCHAHSEIPDTWPAAKEIIGYQNRVRERVDRYYKRNLAQTNRHLGRSLWLGFEHEAMHLETLLYMLLQSEKTLAPPEAVRPDFEAMARIAEQNAVPNQWVSIPEQEFTVGIHDPECDSGPERFFGWDNEKPPRLVRVPAFVSQARPITNGEYAAFLEQTQNFDIPVSWSETSKYIPANGNLKETINDSRPQSDILPRPSAAFMHGKSVRTVYGSISLSLALSWPVMASYNEVASYAAWMNGRIPNMEEVRSIYNYAEEVERLEAEKVLSKTISAVNGHLSNDGVEETPPQSPSRNELSSTEPRPNSQQYFRNLEGCNVGFRNWHPTAVTHLGNKLCGQGAAGGVWEWTSSVLEKFDGFEAMPSYPGYTADFFDTKHNIVLGGSWATHPRIAGRKSFVNWYQRNYPYVWAGARLVRDV